MGRLLAESWVSASGPALLKGLHWGQAFNLSSILSWLGDLWQVTKHL